MSDVVITTRGLTRTIGVEDLDLEVHAGEVFGFLGPNGSGKATTIRLLLDFLRPTRGSARLFGVGTRDAAVRARVGYLPGELSLDGRMSGHATLRFFDALLPAPRRVRPERRAQLTDRLGLAERDLRRLVREARARGATVFHSSHVLSEADRT
jgi:ABC-2 type transport system ATP-binding protein